MPGLQAIRRFQTGGAAYTPDQIRSYIDTQLAGASDAAIRAEMDRFGVTPAQVAAAYNAPVADVQARYEAARPAEFNTFDDLIRSGSFTEAADFARAQGYSPEQVTQYINQNAQQLGLPGGFGTEPISTFFTPPNLPSEFREFDALIRANNFQDAANLAKSLGYSASQVADYLTANRGRLLSGREGFDLNAPITTEQVLPFFQAPPVPLRPGEVESKTPGLTLRNDPLGTRQDQALPLFPDRPEQGRALRGSMGISELVAQPATRPQLNAGIRSLDLATQQFGDLTRLEQGAPQAAFQIPSTAIAPSGEMEAPRQQISREGLSALVNPQFTRFTPSPLTTAGQEFQKLGVTDQFATIRNVLGQNPNMTPTQLVNLMSDFGVTPDMIRRSTAPTAPAPAPAETPAGRAGGMVKYQEGGMAKYSPEEVGSRFDVSEYIDPETGRFYINEFQRDVVFNPELREAERIERLKSQGRGGDTMLVHMSPEEVQGLQALALRNGTTLTINPETGLPEAFKLKKLFKAVAPALPFLIPGVGSAIAGLGAKAGLGALASKAIAAGVIGGFTGGGGFNFKEGLKTGALAYAGGKLFEGMNAANAAPGGAGVSPSATGAEGVKVSSTSGGVPVGVETVADATNLAAAAPTTSSLTPLPTAPVPDIAAPSQYSLSGAAAPVDYSLASQTSSGMAGAPATSSNISGFERVTGVSPTTAIVGGSLGLSAIQASKEQEAFEAAQAARNREDEERRRRYADLFGRTLGTVGAAGGGLVALAKGGVPMMEAGGTTGPTGEPRMVKGTGDGMSDNVPATIEGVQEARLANDEFVVPADVVADIGNGSSSSGAKKLYAMMDRVRKARHGTTEQPPEIDAERLMPA